QALLPQVQFRAAGGGNRGQHRAVADHGAQLRARRGRTLSQFEHRANGADPGDARCADVHHPLALGDRRRAGAAALPRRPQGAAAARAHGRRGPDCGCVSRPDRLRREPHRRARDPRSSAGAPGDRRLSQRSDGYRRPRTPAGADRVRRHPRRQPRPDRAVAAGPRGALEVLSARPYAFLDDAPLEERRTQAVMGRRWLSPETAADLGRLDADAIARVRAEAWPEPANADELHDALVWLGFLREEEAGGVASWREWLAELARQKRATLLHTPGARLWITAERLPQFQALWATAKLAPAISALDPLPNPAPQAGEGREGEPDAALVEILRGRLEGQGPVTQAALAAVFGLQSNDIAT